MVNDFPRIITTYILKTICIKRERAFARSLFYVLYFMLQSASEIRP